MGHLINPISQRVYFSQFWSLSGGQYFDWSFVYKQNNIFFVFKFIFMQGLEIIRKITSNYFHSLLTQFKFNVQNFKSDMCFVDFSVFDFMDIVLLYDRQRRNYIRFFKKKLLKLKAVYFLKNKFLSINRPEFLDYRRRLLKGFRFKIWAYFAYRSQFWLFAIKLVSCQALLKSCGFYGIRNMNIVGRYYYRHLFVSSQMLVSYIICKLMQGFKINIIIRKLVSGLRSVRLIEGFKICVSGRFSRKQIATYRWEKRGNVSLNTMNTLVDYSFGEWISWYGICGVKVWLQKIKRRGDSMATKPFRYSYMRWKSLRK